MAEPRRIQRADAIYLVSNYTIEGLPLMQPSPQANTIIENNLAWAASVRKIKLYVYHFMEDRFFMIFSAPLLNRGKFMGDFQGQTAKQLNALRGRTGKFFARRYECSHLLDNTAIIEQVGRVLSAPCRAEKSPEDQSTPGVSSWPLHRSGEPLVGRRENRTQYRDIKRARPDLSDDQASRLATTTYELDLAKLPMWSDKPHMSYHRQLRSTVRDIIASSTPTGPTAATPGTAGAIHDESRNAASSPTRRRPRCFASDPCLRSSFLDDLSDKNDAYDMARTRLRRGRGTPRFPLGMIPPHITWAVGASRMRSARKVTQSRCAPRSSGAT